MCQLQSALETCSQHTHSVPSGATELSPTYIAEPPIRTPSDVIEYSEHVLSMNQDCDVEVLGTSSTFSNLLGPWSSLESQISTAKCAIAFFRFTNPPARRYICGQQTSYMWIFFFYNGVPVHDETVEDTCLQSGCFPTVIILNAVAFITLKLWGKCACE